MKFAVLFAAVVLAEETSQEVKDDPPAPGKAGEACDPTDGPGCDQSGTPKLRCQTAPKADEKKCIDEAKCGTGEGDAAITCGAKQLAAGALAALAIAATL